MKHPKNIEQRHKNLNSTKKKKKKLIGVLKFNRRDRNFLSKQKQKRFHKRK